MDRRAHADRCHTLPDEMGMEGVSRDVDLMIEAKDKEQAVLFLYRVYGLEEVKWENLRPEKEQKVEKLEEGGEGGERCPPEAGGNRVRHGWRVREVWDRTAERPGNVLYEKWSRTVD